ncbi:MAG TPA: hypothetical protein DCR63_06590 [Microbacterium sp.]|nr:hypothetical protein [Microbacterium sp.]
MSTSGFYHWMSRPASATAARREALTGRMKHFFTASDGTYGYRRVHADLAGEGTECSPELVRQIIRHDLDRAPPFPGRRRRRPQSPPATRARRPRRRSVARPSRGSKQARSIRSSRGRWKEPPTGSVTSSRDGIHTGSP